MVWMETYLLCCSVRLGVIIISLLTFLQLFIPAILFFSLGVGVLDPILELIQNDDHYSENALILKVINWIENSSQNFIIIVNTYLFLHMSFCLLILYAALKLQKWFIVPFATLEFMRVIYGLAGHIILMIILKKILNLGILIAVTLAGGFFILYLGYNWAACVALFQIIKLIHSERYKAIYGDDPFNPLTNVAMVKEYAYGTVENVRVLDVPGSGDVDELKAKQTNLQPPAKAIVPVMPVLPMNNNRKPRWPYGRAKKPKENNAPILVPDKLKHNDYAEEYSHWQWAELVAVPKQKSKLIGQDWKRY